MQSGPDGTGRRKTRVTMDLSRRAVIGGAGLAALSACAGPRRLTSPFSIGEGPPALRVPRGACDSHIHIIDPRFPAVPGWKGEPVNDASVAAYRQFQARIGTQRVVVVTPSTYGADNRATLDALEQFGTSARGVIVIDSDAPPADLAGMTARGVRGIRVNFVSPQPWGKSDVRRLTATARIAAEQGWHIQIYARAQQIADMETVLAALPVPLMIDHLGAVAPTDAAGPDQAAILRLLANGQTWLKLSGAYISSLSGPDYHDLDAIAHSYVRAAPERLVWGSDWPHRGQASRLPDDATLLDLLGRWAPDAALHDRILVDNPRRFYSFG